MLVKKTDFTAAQPILLNLSASMFDFESEEVC